jgi:hypothetical protein
MEFPHLVTLFIILNSFNASSAFIERFFSICGIIATQRNQNSNKDLFYDRANYVLCQHEIIGENNKKRIKTIELK